MRAVSDHDLLAKAGTVPLGHYAKKQLQCESRVVSFSHAARFHMAMALAGSHPAGALLDYGTGDGTFLALVAEQFGTCVGADVAADQIADCRARFASVTNVRFLPTGELRGPGHDAAYDVVTCMEVLEHCLDPVVNEVLGHLVRLVAPGGRVIISVPIEIGPSFVVKSLVRAWAGRRGLSDYRWYESVSLATTARSVFASARTELERPVYGEPGAQFHSHYGFNWRRLRQRVSRSFIVDTTLFSPFNIFGGWFSSQVWFVCRPRPR